MKKGLFLFAFVVTSIATMAQNIQQHYNFGKDQKAFTTTFEYFGLDKLGSTYYFIDLTYGNDSQTQNNTVNAYMELARSFKIGNLPFEPRAEFNSGLYGSAWLAGVQKTWCSADFTKNVTLQLNYKYIPHVMDAAYQITGVWNLDFFDRKFTASGYVDFWREDVVTEGEKHDFVLSSQPQFWYNINKSFSVGTEIQLGNNFAGNDGFTCWPTAAVKWNL